MLSTHFPDVPQIHHRIASGLAADFDRFGQSGLPSPTEPYVLDRYDIDLTTTYAGIPIKNPWGKASGQLSMTIHQVRDDAAAGLGFCVLKTVIAQDIFGTQSMAAWAIPESRMVPERIVSQTGEAGWTITWKGRGWSGSFDDYLQLVRDARGSAGASGMRVVPSCKFHLPGPDESQWRTAEYEHTVKRLLDAYASPLDPATQAMPIEKDFSPTLAGSDQASQQERILEWLRTVPRLIRRAAESDSSGRRRGVRVGLKLFNALFDDDFQVRMLEQVHTAGDDRPDFIVYANRLFDPDRVFEGHKGVAYGGPDLRNRNLRVLERFRASGRPAPPLELSATGDICSGRAAVQYLLHGATSFQIHSYFQLPASEYAMRPGSKIEKALHMLYFHPRLGLIAWLHHLANVLGLTQRPIRLEELAAAARAAS
jgi:hypothetical protein